MFGNKKKKWINEDVTAETSETGKSEIGKDVVSETLALIDAATQGTLDARSRAEVYEGTDRHVMERINSLLDAVIGPLIVSAEYIDRISKGDIPEKITDDYKGDFNEIKNNLNQLIDELTSFVYEMDRMSSQHDAGGIEHAVPC